jgi:hypothetical protein
VHWQSKRSFPRVETLDRVVQNLSALRAAVTDDKESGLDSVLDSEVTNAVKMTPPRKQLLKSLEVEVEHRGRWKGTVQAMTEWAIRKRFPKAKWVVDLHQENNMLLGSLEVLESAGLAGVARSSFKFL